MFLVHAKFIIRRALFRFRPIGFRGLLYSTKRNETKRTKRKVIFNETNETSSISQKPLATSNRNHEIRVGGIDFHL